MSLYYQDEHVTLYHGDSMEILPTLEKGVGVLLTDPPYFKVKQDEWDNQWKKSQEFLTWMGAWLDFAKPLLAANGSAWVFASPAMTSSVERLVGERFRVLNSIRWVKPTGHHMRTSLAAQRRFFPAWEGCIFAEHYSSGPTGLTADAELWDKTFAPMRGYLNEQREAAGLSAFDIDKAWQAERGTKGRMAKHWFERTQWGMPTESHCGFLQRAGLDLRPYSELRAEYEDLRSKYLDQRRPFTITDRSVSTDVWSFASVSAYPGKHPCEKPMDLLTHMVETSSRPGWTILDPFAGSGSTLHAAKEAGRKAIGIEQDERYCEQIANRLERAANQGAFDFGAIA